MGSFSSLGLLLVLGVLSLGGITAEKVSMVVALKDAISSISDAKVKEEINNLIVNRDMDGAESKMMKYILDYATDMTPENQSEKDEFENEVVKAMKIIHEGFNDFKNNAAFEVLDEVIGMMAPNGTKSNHTDGMPPPGPKPKPRKSGPMNQDDAGKLLDEVIGMMAPNGTKSNHTDGMPPPGPKPKPRKSGPMNQDDAGKLLDEVIGMMAPNGTKSNHTDGMPPPGPKPKPRKDGPMNQDDAKMMAKIIEDFPDAAVKAAIINDIEADDFAMAETHMLNALDNMVPNINYKVRAQVHKGMAALKAAAEQFAEEKQEEILIETLEKIKEDQERIEGLLKELGANN